jgi:hypothetical protein
MGTNNNKKYALLLFVNTYIIYEYVKNMEVVTLNKFLTKSVTSLKSRIFNNLSLPRFQIDVY